MPIMSKNIFIVKCDKETFEKSFIRKKNSEIINYYEIYQKLTNNDISKTPPSDEIIEYQIIKKLNNFRDCRRTEFIFFLREKIDRNFVYMIKKFFNNCYVPVFYHLLLDKEIKDTKVTKEFNTVQYLEDDKISDIR